MVKFTKNQETAVLHNQGNMLVSASAGSGKTHVIISRIVRLITEKKAGLDSILAVTFTTAAAAEMKEKLSLALIDEYNKTGDEHLKGQLKLMGAAQVSTVHSFCANILRGYFSGGDYEPNFAILDESQSVLLKNEAADELFDKKYRENDQDFFTSVSEFIRYRKDLSLKKIIIDLYDKTSTFYNAKSSKFDKELYTKDGFMRVLDSLMSLQKDKLDLLYNDLNSLKDTFSVLGSNTRFNYTESLLSFVSLKLSEDTFEDYYEFNEPSIGGVPTIKPAEKEDFPLYRAHEKLKAVKGDLFKLLKEERDFIQGFDSQKELSAFLAGGETSKRLYCLLEEFTAVYREKKRKENALDYDDLQLKAIELLQDERILSSVREKYSYIFIDEYQDVNELQETLLTMLSHDNLFMVGDLKQSIYSFRGCDPRFFAEKYESYFAGGGHAVRLNDNFRSSGGVIDGVNAVFDNIMTLATAGTDYRGESRLTSGGLYPDSLGKTQLITVNKEREKAEFSGEIYDLTADMGSGVKLLPHPEGRAIADIITDECQKEYYDIKTGGYRQISFSDIVVLGASRTSFNDISKELKSAGIPVSSDAGEDIKDYPEVKLLINLLELIDNKNQDVPLASVLKSPIGGFTDAELAEIRLAGGGGFFYECYNQYAAEHTDALADKIRGVNEYIQKIRLLSDFMGAGELLSRVLTEKGIELKYLPLKSGEVSLARIDRFIKESRAGGRVLSCKDFLKRLKNPRLEITLGVSGAENAVTLMTIHKSKGLEFPVVIICGCATRFNFRDEHEAVLFDKEFGITAKYYNTKKMTSSDTALRLLVKSRMRFKLAQDQMRLFYVAMTRAKYNLYLISSSPVSDSNYSYAVKTALSFTQFLNGSNILEGDRPTNQTEKTSLSSPKNIVLGRADKEFTEAVKMRLYKEYPFKDAISLPVKTNVSAVLGSERDEYLRVSLFGESSAEKGTAYHAFLQHADLSGNISAVQCLNDMLAADLLTKEQYAMIDKNKAQRILNMPVFKELANKKLLKEQEFLIELPAKMLYGEGEEKVLLQGVIDLIAISDDGLEIIDYKLSSIKEDADIREKYSKQLELYGYAASKILSLPVKSLKIVNILSETVI